MLSRQGWNKARFCPNGPIVFSRPLRIRWLWLHWHAIYTALDQTLTPCSSRTPSARRHLLLQIHRSLLSKSPPPPPFLSPCYSLLRRPLHRPVRLPCSPRSVVPWKGVPPCRPRHPLLPPCFPTRHGSTTPSMTLGCTVWDWIPFTFLVEKIWLLIRADLGTGYSSYLQVGVLANSEDGGEDELELAPWSPGVGSDVQAWGVRPARRRQSAWPGPPFPVPFPCTAPNLHCCSSKGKIC
jgi:hypothetical protein